jgi:hypothetical protein
MKKKTPCEFAKWACNHVTYILQWFSTLIFFCTVVSHLELKLPQQDNTKKEEREVVHLDSDENMESDIEDESENDQPYVMECEETTASEDEDDLEDEPETQ